MRYRVTHTTTYVYDEIVSIGHNEVRLEPRATPRQRCLTTRLEIDPTPAVLSPELDYFGNRASFFTLQEPHHRMLVTASSELEIVSAPPLRPERTPAWDDVRSALPYDTAAEGLAAFEMSLESPLVPPVGGVRGVRRAVVRGGPPDPRSRARPDGAHPRRLRVPARRHLGDHAGDRGARSTLRGVPGTSLTSRSPACARSPCPRAM